MFKSIFKILLCIVILLAGAVLKNLIDLSWRVSTGLDSNGLSSLTTLVAIAFSFTILLPLKGSSRRRVMSFFKGAFKFLFVWLAASFSSALLHQPRHVSIGLIPALLYASIRLGLAQRLQIKIACVKTPVDLKKHHLILSVAPNPKITFLQGFGLKSLLHVLRGKARVRLRSSEDVFIRSFRYSKTLRINGSLSSFIENVEKNTTHNVAIVCEAKPLKRFFRLSVKIASDSLRELRTTAECFSKTDYDESEDIESALKKWRALKPCVKPVSGPSGETLLDPSWITGRIAIAGNWENVERMALQICLSQLRRNSMILIVGDDQDFEVNTVFKEEVKRILEVKAFRLSGDSFKTCRVQDGVEIVFASRLSLNKNLLRKILSKPVVAVWFRTCIEDFEPETPVKILTLREPGGYTGFEADSIILVDCDKTLAECLIPVGYRLALEGRTAIVSSGGVKILT